MNKTSKAIAGTAGGALIGLATGTVVSHLVGAKIKEEMAKVEDKLEGTLSQTQKRLLFELKLNTKDLESLPSGSYAKTEKENSVKRSFTEWKKSLRGDQLKLWKELDELGKKYEKRVKSITSVSALLGGAAGGFLVANI